MHRYIVKATDTKGNTTIMEETTDEGEAQATELQLTLAHPMHHVFISTEED